MSRDVFPPLLLAPTGDLQLESGEILRGVVQAYRRDGPPGPPSGDVVLVLHGASGSPADYGGLEPGVVGAGSPLDPGRSDLLAPALLGAGLGSRFAFDGAASLTSRDRARAVGLLLRRLGIRAVSLAVGVGDGLRVAEALAASFPALVRRVTDASRLGTALLAERRAAAPFVPIAPTGWASGGATAGAR